LNVIVVIEYASQRLIHCNVTAHPSAAWTLPQLRELVGSQQQYECLLHDRDSIFANHLNESIERLGVKVLKSPPRSPMVNAVCERVIGTIRHECLDWVIPFVALGPGVPDPPLAHSPTRVRNRAIAAERHSRRVADSAAT
jgi:putative transposase